MKRHYRLVDFKFAVAGKAEILAIEFDPNRSANLALVQLEDGGKAYILAGSGMKVGDKVASGPDAEIKKGNRLALAAIRLARRSTTSSWYSARAARSLAAPAPRLSW